MKVAILGYARQGLSAYKYYSLKGADITVHDQDTDKQVPAGVATKLGPGYLDNLDEYDVLVRTPYLHPSKILTANPGSPNILDKVTTATNEFMDLSSTPIIGVTGTKGKGTTSLLIEAILSEAGYKVALGGNIGISPLDMIDEAEAADYVVLELSNFQTIDMDASPSVGVCLAITPEHLDWHTDYEEYVQAKSQMFGNQAASDVAVYAKNNSDSHRAVAGTAATNVLSYAIDGSEASVYISGDQIMSGGQAIAKVGDIKLLGVHNQNNVCAAIAATWGILRGNSAPIIAALHKCTGFEFRLETVSKKGGVTYINDSYGSAPEATIAALAAVAQPKVMIIGGHDKGADMGGLVSALAKSNTTHIVAIGDTGPAIADAVTAINPGIGVTKDLTTMQSIVEDAADHAKRGDAVMLSTGCASFGLFKNFEDRGQQFNKAVLGL